MIVESAVDRIKSEFADQVLGTESSCEQIVISVKRDKIINILKLLRGEFEFDSLIDLCGLDCLNAGTPERFAVVYNLYSLRHKERIRIKAFIPEKDPTIDSASGLWLSVNWAEREAYDMYGIKFLGHPGLRRLLLPDDYGSYPLRKDYPVTGLGERNRFTRYYPNESRP
jgi:NADH-quinone oxidoreductase subunit C